MPLNKKNKNLPKQPGVYIFYNKNKQIIYIGKASVLKHRVGSYFVGAHDNKTTALISEINDIKYKITNSTIEALILESNLIKKYQPKYNVREKDDKSFIQIILTKEKFPKFIATRATNIKSIKKPIKKIYGPYTDIKSVNEILQYLRKIFPFRDCTDYKFKRQKKLNQPCIYHSLNLCPAPCVNYINEKKYKETIKQINNFLEGKNKKIINYFKKQMTLYAKKQAYEQAAQIRNKIFALEHINDIAFIKSQRPLEQSTNIPKRIECYDISNMPVSKNNKAEIYAVGSMIVFENGEMEKSQYRKFKIKYSFDKNTKNKYIQTNDPAMISQVVERRLHHKEWQMPDLIILDGGKTQLSAVSKIFIDKKIKLPLIAIAKGPTRKGFKLFRNNLAKNIILDKKFLESIRDEAHRFAIKYLRKRQIKSIKK